MAIDKVFSTIPENGDPTQLRGLGRPATPAPKEPDVLSISDYAHYALVIVIDNYGTGNGKGIRKLSGAVADAKAIKAVLSDDRTCVVTASKDGTARVWTLLGTQALMDALWRGTSTCLSPDERVKVLGETPEEAAENNAASLAKVATYRADGGVSIAAALDLRPR